LSVVDSSGWIEFLTNGANASAFVPELERPADLVIPTIVVTEVLRWLRSHGRAAEAEVTFASMSAANVVSLSAALADLAAEVGIRHRLPLADGIVYATAQSLGVDVWTQDRDFQGLPGIRYIPKPSG
jgi:predicted nucleic acid-binding protein